MIGLGTDTLRTVPVKAPSRLAVAKAQDCERLAELSRKHRDAILLTNERSMEFLQWRYEHSTAASPRQVYSFKDKAGIEGWFALAQVSRGRRGQVRGTVPLDFDWPRQKFKLSHVLSVAA